MNSILWLSPGDLSTDFPVVITHAKKKIVFSFPSHQPDGEAGQPVGVEDETSKNEVGNDTKNQCLTFNYCEPSHAQLRPRTLWSLTN